MWLARIGVLTFGQRILLY
ncbi:hypothetical protein LINPERPRIM_LOCUS28163 [Linum perenne]